jgi:hypothetical protein
MQPNDQQPAQYPQQPQPVSGAPQAEYPKQQPADRTQQVTQSPALSTNESGSEIQQVATELPQPVPIVWQDIEYIQHEKGPMWYVGFFITVIVFVIGAVLLQAWTFIPLIIVMAVALVIYTHREPRHLNYTWSAKGLTINDQLHPTGEFKSFGVIQDSGHNALSFIPVKRFRPGLTVFFPVEVGEQLVDAVGAYLPMQDIHLDAFDQIIRKLRI